MSACTFFSHECSHTYIHGDIRTIPPSRSARKIGSFFTSLFTSPPNSLPNPPQPSPNPSKAQQSSATKRLTTTARTPSLMENAVCSPSSLLGEPHSALNNAYITSVPKTTSTSTTTVAVRPPKPAMKRLKLNFLVLMDTSYSMHGDRIIAACDGLDLFHNEVFGKDDYMGLLVFDSRVIMLHEPMMVKKVNRAFDRKDILRTALNGRSTAMYDALHTGLTSLKDKLNDPNFKHLKSGDSVFHIVMLTDGCDNSSTKASLSSVSALVANSGIPNFHLTVVGISMPRDTTAELRSTLCAPKHAQYIEVDDIAQLRTTMKRVVRDVNARMFVQVRTIFETVEVTKDGRTDSVKSVTKSVEGISLGGVGTRRWWSCC